MSDANSVLKRIGNYDLSGNRLGKGNFAYVELATNRATKTEVAIKVIDTGKISDERIKRCVLREASILRKINHPNVVRLYETLKQHSTFCIVTEFVPGGELLSFLRSQHESKLSESQARPIIRQLVSAVCYLHEHGIAHRDLKLENILLDEAKKNIKIVDFGLSNICSRDEMLKTQCGSPEYAAPELFSKECRYGPEVDLWSLGVIIYGTVIGKLPFRTPHTGARGRSELVDQTNRGLTVYHNKYLVKLTPYCRDLLRKLLQPDPHFRLPLADVMVHPWISAQGTWPLVSYKEPAVDEGFIDKVIGKVSQITKIRKSKIAAHVQSNRFDAICGIYNIIIDEERKNNAISEPLAGDRDTRDMRSDRTDGKVISVSVKRIGNESRGPEGDDSLTSDSSDETLCCEEKRCTGDAHSRNRNQHCSSEKPLESLQIRGRRIYSADSHVPKKRKQRKARPNTANVSQLAAPDNSSPMNFPSKNTPTSTRDDAKFKDDVRGLRMVMSPRTRKLNGEDNAPQQGRIHAFGQTNITEEEDAGNISGKNSEGSIAGDEFEVLFEEEKDGFTCSGSSTAASPTSDAVHGNCIERQGSETLLPGTPVKGKPEGNPGKAASVACKSENPSKTPCYQIRPSVPRSKIQSQVKTVEDPIAQINKGAKKEVSLKEYRRLMSQAAVRPPKARRLGDMTYKEKYARTQSETSSPRPQENNPTDKRENANKQMSESLATIYQCYLANNKPQHRRLSIMQAQEILHHERKFQAKYGRRTESGNSEQENLFTELELDENTQLETPQNSPSVSSHNRIPRRTRQPQVCFRKIANSKGVTLHEEQRKLPQNFSKRLEPQCRPVNQKHQGHGRTTEAVPTDDKPNKSDGGTTGHEREADRIKQRQDNSLKRQIQVQRQEEMEKEKHRIKTELEDQDRVGIIQRYLENVYSQHGTELNKDETKPTERDSRPRTYKVTTKGRLYSLLPRSPTPPKVVTMAAPILGQCQQTGRASTGSRVGERRVTFKGQAAEGSKRGITYLNDWNKTAFVSYMNSETEEGAETDEEKALQGQLNDASYWLHQHFNGVVGKATIRDGAREHGQLASRQE